MRHPLYTSRVSAAICRETERLLLRLYLLCALWLFLSRLGIEQGYDIGAHMEMLNLVTWADPSVPLRESFYSYHPPLAFLLARSFHLLGFAEGVAVQILSFLATLINFFSLRLTLKTFGLLSTLPAILFLYLAVAIPLTVFLSTSLNLDVLILACASVVLYLSVCLFWNQQCSSWYALALVALLAIAMLIKFSGALIFALPVIVALFSPQKKLRSLRNALVIVILSLALILPYYVTRYHIPEGTFFPNNADWMVGGALADSRMKLREHPLRFFGDLFSSTPVHREQGIEHKDYDVLRLADTWRDYWLKDQFLGPGAPLSKEIGSVYLLSVPWLLAGGFVLFLRRKNGVWKKLGWVFLSFSFLQFLAFLAYLIEHPFAGWGPTKAIYIAPTIWGMGYLLSCLVPPDPPPRKRRVIVGLTATFMVVNYLLPIYA